MEDVAFKKILAPAYPTEPGIGTLRVPDDENHDTTRRLQAAAHWLSLYCEITVSFPIYKQVTTETRGCIPARGKTWACTIPHLPGIRRRWRRVRRLEGSRAMLRYSWPGYLRNRVCTSPWSQALPILYIIPLLWETKSTSLFKNWKGMCSNCVYKQIWDRESCLREAFIENCSQFRK